jgi:type III pantothenate kinase
MKLLVDIGNSRVKWSWLDDKGLQPGDFFIKGKTGIKAGLTKAWKSFTAPTEILVSNVAGDKIAQQLIEWTEKTWQLTPVFIQSEKKRFGVLNAYEQPETLGVDRWLNLIAARQHTRQPVCIIDCGTAITVDIVTEKGQHQGGMILPGLAMMRHSLATHTEALTEQVDSSEFNLLATNTFSAIQVGTLYSVTATLDNIISDLKHSFKDNIRFVLTGGDTETQLELLPEGIEADQQLVFKGIRLYAKQGKTALKQLTAEQTDSEDTDTQDA